MPTTKKQKGERELTLSEVRDIRVKHASGDFPIRKLARIFHVSQVTIQEALTKKKWKHL